MTTVIIGGGLCGLHMAYQESKKGKSVVVIEKEKELGGLLSSWDMKDYKIEKFYHHLSKNDTEFVKLLKELGIEKNLKWKLASNGYYYYGKIYKMDTPWDILKFKGLSFVNTLRLCYLVVLIKIKKDPTDSDNTTAKEWLIDKGGKTLYENFFEPLLKSKFGGNLESISASWLFGRIKWRSKRGLLGEYLGYMENGFYVVIEKLEEKIIENGGRILINEEVLKITENKVVTKNNVIDAERIISTLPPERILKITDLPKETKYALQRTKYQYTICVLFGLNRKLMDDIYWLNLKHPEVLFGAIIEHTNFHKTPQYKQHLVYVVSYIQNESNAQWQMSDIEIEESFTYGVEKMFPSFNKSQIRWCKVARTKHSSPVYDVGYRERINNIKGFNGIEITGMFKAYPERSIEEAIKMGL